MQAACQREVVLHYLDLLRWCDSVRREVSAGLGCWLNGSPVIVNAA